MCAVAEVLPEIRVEAAYTFDLEGSRAHLIQRVLRRWENWKMWFRTFRIERCEVEESPEGRILLKFECTPESGMAGGHSVAFDVEVPRALVDGGGGFFEKAGIRAERVHVPEPPGALLRVLRCEVFVDEELASWIAANIALKR